MSFRLTNRALINTLKAVSKNAVRQSALRAAPVRAVSATLGSSRLFSTTYISRNQATQQVSEALKNELEHEKEDPEEFPEELESFLKTSGFEIAESRGLALAKLVKKTDNEIVHVFFDVNQVVNIRPAEVEELEEESETFDEAYENSYINLNVVVEKKSDNSAVAFDVLVGPEDGATYIENVTSYANSAEALTESAEADQKREIAYNGPSFTNLDEALQISLESYLSSRGITEELYQFVLNYGVHKENQEYLAWLEKLNNFFK